ncbi:hypothetical protein C5O19_09490 [Siphonobacter curvatus]|uniref:Uncharacterized protein n=2 Tax=Siphonobacter curvatus TaxID=2094562 RepID=A0A2S7IQ43_9BACT|nr:hypothetical protein C5O19_09490 [Siphonobacter curvatus]
MIRELEAAGYLVTSGGKNRIIKIGTLNCSSVSDVYNDTLELTLNHSSGSDKTTLNHSSGYSDSTMNSSSVSIELTLNHSSELHGTIVQGNPELWFSALYKVESKEESKKENLEEEGKKGDSECFEKGETPHFVQANREQIKNLIPVGPSPLEVAGWLFENAKCREHACLKIKSIKRDSDEDYRDLIAHFIRYNGARNVQWDSFESAAEHFMKMISRLNGFNPAKDNPQTHGKSKPKSGSYIPVDSTSRPKPEQGKSIPRSWDHIQLDP